MKGDRKKTGSVLFVFWMLVVSLFGSTGLADGNAAIMEVCTNEEDLSVYVKDAGSSFSDVSVQIGTSSSSQISCQSIQDTEFETLILVDNSLSIPKDMRSRITEFLGAFLDAKAQNEKVAIGVFSRDITYLTGFTSDYDTLEDAAEQISYQNQDTYITDMLYELLRDDYCGSGRDIYRRIVIIADGVDNESLGYTIDELKQLIKEDTYPIYTIGCRTGSNDSELENLFALSRQSNAEYFLMDSAENIPSVVDALGRDKEIIKVIVVPTADLRDGSVKTVKINFQGQSVSKEMRMPQQEKIEAVETLESETETQESSIAESEESTVEETSAADEEALQKLAAKKFIIVVIVAWVCIIIAFITAYLTWRYRKKQSIEQTNARSLMEQREEQLSQALPNSPKLSVSKPQNTVDIVLMDVHIPKNSFRISVNAPIVIGRSRENCHLVVEYDKSVSGTHCEIYLQNDKVMIKDLNSTNGTFVNGDRVLKDTELTSGNTIVLGHLEMRLDIVRG